jgi:hypothetical protein
VASLFDSSPPSGSDFSDGPYTLGVRFRSSVAGQVTGVRWYNPAGGPTAVEVGLWSDTGTLLASKSGTVSSAAGWYEIAFDSPVSIAANTPYRVGRSKATGNYRAAANFYASEFSNPPLTAYAVGGKFFSGGGLNFPDSDFNNSNYWTDVLFTAAGGAGETIVGIFAVTAAPDGWFDETARPLGWFDPDLTDIQLAAAAVSKQQNFDWPWEEVFDETLTDHWYQQAVVAPPPPGLLQADWDEQTAEDDLWSILIEVPQAPRLQAIAEDAFPHWESLADEGLDVSSTPVAAQPLLPPFEDLWQWEEVLEATAVSNGFLQINLEVPVNTEHLWADDEVEDFEVLESGPVFEVLTAPPQQFDWLFEEVEEPALMPVGYQQADPVAAPAAFPYDTLWVEEAESLEEFLINDFAQVEDDPRVENFPWLFEEIEDSPSYGGYQQASAVTPSEPALPGPDAWDFDSGLPDYTVIPVGYQQADGAVVVSAQPQEDSFPFEDGEGLEELLILDFAQVEEDQAAFELIWNFDEVCETSFPIGYTQSDGPPEAPPAIPADAFTFDFDVVLDEFQVNDFPQIEEDPTPPAPGGGSVGGGAYGGGDSGGYLRNFLDRALKEVRKESRQREVLSRLRPVETQPEAVQQELLLVLSPTLPEVPVFPPEVVRELLTQLERDLLEEEEFVVLQLLML